MEDKKSIVVYADWIESFEALTDEEAGKLIKHFFRYVNDLSPEYPDRLTELSFIPIKQSLKRDLEKWKSTKEDRSTNGRKGNLRRYNVDLYDKFVAGELSLEDAEAIAINRKTSPPDKKDRPPTKKVANVAVNVNDSVSVNVNDIKETYRAFAHLSLSIDDYEKLESEYEKRTIDMVLDSIENYKDNKKYKSLYLTAKKWLSKEPKKRSVVEADEWDKDFQVGDVMPNGATLTPDVQHHHNMTGFSYKRLAGL